MGQEVSSNRTKNGIDSCGETAGRRRVVRTSVFPTHVVVWASLLQIPFVCFMSCSTGWAQTLPEAPDAQQTKIQRAEAPEANWPRTVTSGTDKFLIYQPQVEKWEGNCIDLYGAVELKM